MQRDNGSPAACASCRHQRKKCTANCLLAPYFPLEKNKEFQAVHKLFGVSNITKILNSLNTADRKRAVDSLVWEATCRQKDPVLGSYGEFNRVLEELNFYKTQFGTNFQQSDGLAVHYLDSRGLNNNSTFFPMNKNRNTLIPCSYPSLVNYPSMQHTTDRLREEFSCNYPPVQNMEKFKEDSNNSSVILPPQFGVQNSNNSSVILPPQFGVQNIENLNLKQDLAQKYQPYYQLPGQYRSSGDTKPGDYTI